MEGGGGYNKPEWQGYKVFTCRGGMYQTSTVQTIIKQILDRQGNMLNENYIVTMITCYCTNVVKYT